MYDFNVFNELSNNRLLKNVYSERLKITHLELISLISERNAQFELIFVNSS